jgi:hypothetical protein
VRVGDRADRVVRLLRGALPGAAGDGEERDEGDPVLPAGREDVAGVGALVARGVAVLDAGDPGDPPRRLERGRTDVGQADVSQQSLVAERRQCGDRGRYVVPPVAAVVDDLEPRQAEVDEVALDVGTEVLRAGPGEGRPWWRSPGRRGTASAPRG